MFSDEDLKGKSYLNIPLFDDGDHGNENDIERPKYAVQSNMFSFLPEDVVVLSSCNGLICCRSCGSMSKPRKTTFYICNPMNNQWVTLDCPHFDRLGSFALACDPYKDPTNIPKFNLVSVQQNYVEDEMHFPTYFQIYSSEKQSWKRSKAKCLYKHEVLENIPGIYIKGVVYWQADIGPTITSDNILSFDVEKESSLVISPPISSPGFRVTCIGEWNEHLYYIMITKRGVHVWYLEDYNENIWKQKLLKPLGEIGRANSKFNDKLKKLILQGSGWIGLLNFTDGTLVMFLEDEVYIYNIEKDMAVEVCKHQDLSAESIPCLVFPYFKSSVPQI